MLNRASAPGDIPVAAAGGTSAPVHGLSSPSTRPPPRDGAPHEAKLLPPSAFQHSKQVTSTRSGFLMSLNDMVGPPPMDRTWRDEWTELNVEVALTKGFRTPNAEDMKPGGTLHGSHSRGSRRIVAVKQNHSLPQPLPQTPQELVALTCVSHPFISLVRTGTFHYHTKLETYAHQVTYKTESGWTREDAQAHVALSGVCSSVLAESIKKKDPRFAASVHALYTALAHTARRQVKTPPTCYAWIQGTGNNSLEGLVPPHSHMLRTSDPSCVLNAESPCDPVQADSPRSTAASKSSTSLTRMAFAA
jgi:hypothetical protein